MDIAPLGFAVDTAPLLDAANVAESAAVSISGVADATDKVADATASATPKLREATSAVQSATTAHREGTAAAQQFAQVHKETAASATAAATGVSALERDMRLLQTTLDPTYQQTLKYSGAVDALNRLHDAGRVSADMYRNSLAQLQAEMAKTTHAQDRSADPEHNPMGEFLRSATYRLPYVGREARRIIGEGESGFPMTGIIAGAAGGMIGGEALRMLLEMPGKMAEATDQAERLGRQLDAIGASGGLQQAVSLADQLNLSTKAAADAMVKYSAALSLVPAASGQTGADAFNAAMYAGRVGGLDEQQRAQSADQLGSLAAKGVLSASDVMGLSSTNPTLANAIGQQLGVNNGNGLAAMASSGKLTGDALITAAASVNDELKRQSDQLPRTAKEWETAAKNSQEEADKAMGDGIMKFFYHASDTVNRWLADHLSGDGGSSGPSVTVKLPAARPATSPDNQVIDAAMVATQGVGNANSRAGIEDQLTKIADALRNGATGDKAQTLMARQRSLELSLDETPYGKLVEQTNDLAAALGGAGGQSGMIGVWQQAIQVEREQEKQANGTAQSIGSIVEQLKALKRAQQEVNDEQEIRKLSESIATTAARIGAAGQGSYEQGLQGVLIKNEFDTRDRYQFAAGTPTATPATGAPTGAPGGAASLQDFLSAIRFAESRNRDYVSPGHPLMSHSGAMFAMQVMPGTAQNPGYGIAPALTPTPEAFDRVGTDLATHWFNYFHGDVTKAAAAYHNGLGGVNQRGPEFMSYLSTINRQLGGRMGGVGGVAGAPGGTIADHMAQVQGMRVDEYNLTASASAAEAIAKLVGDPTAFANGSVVSGGSAGNAAQMAALIGSGKGTEADTHPLQLTQQILETIKQYPPEYRKAAEDAMRLNDANQLHLKSAERIFKLQQDTDDNIRRAAASRSGNTGASAYTDFLISLDKIKEGPGSDAEKADERARQTASYQSQQDLRVAGVFGGQADRRRDLTEQLTLLKYQGEELDKQRRIYEDNQKIEAAMFGQDRAAIDYAKQRNAEEIEINATLQKRLRMMTDIDDSFQHGFNIIGDAWSKMMGDVERTGKLHFSTMLRGFEDGFYQMVDDMYKKLVVSPLLNMLEKIVSNFATGLLGGGNAMAGFGGDPTGGSGMGADPFAASTVNIGNATGNVFGPRGLVPFAHGGIFNAPTRFAYGGGAQGIAGEGPGIYEAIMPLKRGADGKLGVAGGGGGDGGTQVIINDHRGAGSPAVEVQERRASDGKRVLELTLREQQRSNVQSGRMDADMRGAYGISRPPVSR